jgi:predicted nucleotidyltransferase
MKTLKEIQTILHAHADELRERYGITNLAVFGSVVRGEAREDSDVDVLAEVVHPIGLIGLVGAENYLSDLLGVKVDLVLKRSVRRELREQIYGEAVAV